MTFQIGRLGLDDEVGAPIEWTQDGDDITVSGWLTGTTLAEANAKRQQCLGLVNNPWELSFPVVASYDSVVNGQYAVTAANCSPVLGVSFRQYRFQYSVSMTRLPGYAGNRYESYVVGAARTTATGGISEVFWHAVPSAAQGYSAASTVATRNGPDGSVEYYESVFYGSGASPSWVLYPSNYYDMAPTISFGGYAVVGNQTGPDYSDFEVSNGLIRINTNGSNSTTSLYIAGATGTPGAWGTARQITPGIFNSPNFDTFLSYPVSARVLRNDPAEVVLRLIYTAAVGSVYGYVNVDIGLKRGDRMARMNISCPGTENFGMKIGVASTSLTGGIRQTSNDSDTNRLVLCSAAAITKDTTNGWIYLTSAGNNFDAGIGLEIGGSGSSAPDRAADLRDQYFAVVGETQRAVAL